MISRHPTQRFLCATQKNRPSDLFSDCLVSKIKQKGDVSCLTNTAINTTAVSYYDSGKCQFLSNYCGTVPHIPGSRPLIIEQYNIFMGGVDNFDAGFNRYLYLHKKHVWTQCYLINLLKMAMVNAWTLFRHSKAENVQLSQKSFIVAWLKSLSKAELPKTPQKPTDKSYHWCMRLFEDQQRCIYCKFRLSLVRFLIF